MGRNRFLNFFIHSLDPVDETNGVWGIGILYPILIQFGEIEGTHSGRIHLSDGLFYPAIPPLIVRNELNKIFKLKRNLILR